MKRTKTSKLLAFLLAVLMLVSLFPLTAFAEEETPEGNEVSTLLEGNEEDKQDTSLDDIQNNPGKISSDDNNENNENVVTDNDNQGEEENNFPLGKVRASSGSITITVRVFVNNASAPNHGAYYVIGTDTAQKASSGIQSIAYQIPQLSKFAGNTQFGRVQKVAGNWYFPSGDLQPGTNIYWSNNSSTGTMTYWVDSWGTGSSGSDLWQFTLNYNANGGNNAPASQYYGTNDRYTKSYTFNVSTQKPTREGYTFMGWAESSTSTTATVQPGGTYFVAQTASGYNGGSVTKTLYAVWQQETPPEPNEPSYDELKDLLGDRFVKVHCTNGYVDHGDGFYGLMEGSYVLNGSGTTYTLSVNAEQYVTAYGNGHRLADNAVNPATVTLTYANNQWSAAPTQVQFDVICDEKPDPPAPDAPNDGELGELLGNEFITVECDKHGTTSYGLIGGSYTSTGVVENDGVYTVTITVAAEKYVEKYNEALSGHTLTGDSSKTVTLTWDAETEKWTKPAEGITFTVECKDKPAEGDVKVMVQVVYTEDGETHENGNSGWYWLDCSMNHNHGNNCMVDVNKVKEAAIELNDRDGYTLQGWLTAREGGKWDSFNSKFDTQTVWSEGVIFYVEYKKDTTPTPTEPEKPTDEELVERFANGLVNVDCTNETADHATKSYALMAGSFESSEVESAGDFYYFTMTVKPDAYVAAYNRDMDHNHATNDKAKIVTLTWDGEKWVANVSSITFYVACNNEPEPTAPEKPGHEDLSKLLGGEYVKVDCVNDAVEHATKGYALMDGSYESTEVENAEGVYYFTIHVDPALYVAAYNQDVKDGHSTKDGKKPVVLMWNADSEKWIANPDSITFNVVCNDKHAPEKPGHEDLSKLLGEAFVQVDCVNTTVEHATKGYALMDGSYESTEVENAEGVYYFAIHVDPAAYVAAYNQDVEDGHSTKDGKKPVVLMWNADENKWVPNPKSITFNVACENGTYQYELHYNANGGEGGPKDETIVSGEIQHEFTVGAEKPSYTGKVFLGWADDKEASAAKYSAGDKITVKAEDPVKTVFAVWGPDENGNGVDDRTEKFTVTYTDGVEGERIFDDQVYEVTGYGAPTPKFKGEPSRDGYTFKGWEPGVADTVTKTVTYKAIWEKKTTGPVEPEEETTSWSVRKVWKDSYSSSRPASVTVQLKKDGAAYGDPVKLSKDNDWSYTWTGLPKDGVYEIVETGVPKGYKASYSTSANTVTITNTRTQTAYTSDGKLLQTGQLNWPIPVLCAMGMVLMSTGLYLFFQKKKGRYEN